MKISGNLKKMSAQLIENTAHYTLRGENGELHMNDLLGHKLSLHYENVINCIKCGRETSKSFGGGYCYPCFRDAPENSECVIRPEKCRAHLGEGRDMEWERKHHLQPQYVYLSITAGIKVGVTRKTQIPTRWIDQGAVRGILIAETTNRYEAGVIESALKEHMSDKTAWQRMLKGEINDAIDPVIEKEKALELFPDAEKKFFLKDRNEVTRIEYPMEAVPQKVKSLKLDKLPEITGTLTGIKGQYLIFDNQYVINIRSHSGYLVTVNV